LESTFTVQKKVGAAPTVNITISNNVPNVDARSIQKNVEKDESSTTGMNGHINNSTGTIREAGSIPVGSTNFKNMEKSKEKVWIFSEQEVLELFEEDQGELFESVEDVYAHKGRIWATLLRNEVKTLKYMDSRTMVLNGKLRKYGIEHIFDKEHRFGGYHYTPGTKFLELFFTEV
jgi:hypothetical protein